MLSGSFHVMSQEWRYYSREKALIHTLHLAQLPDSEIGDPVFILPVPPTGTQGNGFNVPPLNIPIITPYHGLSITKVVNNFPPLWTHWNGVIQFTGSYGNWSGVFFTDLAGIPNAEDNGEYYLPATGGAFLFGADGRFPSLFAEMSQLQLSIAQPLVGSDQISKAPDPSNYANTFCTWKQQGILSGPGWNDFNTGNKSVSDRGNADPGEVPVIIDNVPFFGWIGYRQTTSSSIFLRAPAYVFRLGP